MTDRTRRAVPTRTPWALGATVLLAAAAAATPAAAQPAVPLPAAPRPVVATTTDEPPTENPLATAEVDGLWYMGEPGYTEAHATATGEGITVAVIDGTINPDVPELAGADVVVREKALCGRYEFALEGPATSTLPEAQHATSMVALIAGTGEGVGGQPGVQGVAPGARVLHYTTTGSENSCKGGLGESIDQAVLDGADIISVSMYSVGGTDEAAIARAYAAGVIIVAAVDNETGVADWPAGANGVVAVDQISADLETYNDGFTQADVVAPGVHIRQLSAEEGRWDTYRLSSGSSPATAITAGTLAVAWSAYPDATANQMVQHLLRHTFGAGGELGEPSRDIGYGVVSVLNMLDHDPRQNPDVNPLISADEHARPPLELIENPPELVEPGYIPPDTPAPTESAPAAPPQAGGEDGAGGALPVPLLVGGGVAALLAVAGVAAAVAASRRRAAGAPHHHPMTPPAPERT